MWYVYIDCSDYESNPDIVIDFLYGPFEYGHEAEQFAANKSIELKVINCRILTITPTN